jgi:hypothetical protein
MLPSRNGEQNETTGLLSFFFCLLMIVNAAALDIGPVLAGHYASVLVGWYKCLFRFSKLAIIPGVLAGSRPASNVRFVPAFAALADGHLIG